MDDEEIDTTIRSLASRIFVAVPNPTHVLLYVIAMLLLNIWRDHNRRENDAWQRKNS